MNNNSSSNANLTPNCGNIYEYTLKSFHYNEELSER